MQQAKQRIPIKRLRTIRRADCRMVQFAELLCHVLRNTVVFHIPLDRTSALILEPNTGHILVVAALDETILAHTREPLAEIAANVHLVIQITRPQRRGQRVHTHEYDVHGVVLLNFYLPYRPTPYHAEPVRNNSCPRSREHCRALPAGIA